MKKIAIAGNIILDVVKNIETFPQKGMLVNISETSYAVGGCVCNRPQTAGAATRSMRLRQSGA